MRLKGASIGSEVVWLAAGALLRLLWPTDFQFKLDEARNLEFSLAISEGGEWVTHAWLTSVGIPAGPVAAYLFAAITRFTTDPFVANLVVVLANVGALAMAIPFYQLLLPERADARAAFALHAASPMAIWFSRKIWDQCLLAVFTVPALWVAILVARKPRSRAIALLPPLLALASQTHHAGFFFALVLSVVVFLRPARIAAIPLLIGSAVAAALSAPYALHLLRTLSASGGFQLRSISRFPDIDVVTNLLLDASGHNVLDAAGRDAMPLLSWPAPPIGLLVILAGIPLYVCLIAGALEALGVRSATSLPGDSRRLLAGLGIGLPLLYLILRVRGVPHYFLPIFPALFALIALGARRLRRPKSGRWRLAAPPLGVLLAVNVATWALFATYVHAHWGGESYGLPYGRLLGACREVAAEAAARGLGTEETPLRLRVDIWRERGLLPKQYDYVLNRVLRVRTIPPATPEEADLILDVHWPPGAPLHSPPYTLRSGP